MAAPKILSDNPEIAPFSGLFCVLDFVPITFALNREFDNLSLTIFRAGTVEINWNFGGRLPLPLIDTLSRCVVSGLPVTSSSTFEDKEGRD